MRIDELRDEWVGVSVEKGGEGGGDDDSLDDLILWVEIKKQIKILREAIEDGGDEDEK